MNNQPNPQFTPAMSSSSTVGTAVAIQGGSLVLGIIGGLVAAIVGAVIWAVIVAATKYETGIIAILVGALVGFAVRFFGRGTSIVYGIVGGVMALLAVIVGTLLAYAIIITNDPSINTTNISLVQTLQAMVSDPGGTFSLLQQTTTAQDLLFYAIAIFEGIAFAMGRGMRRRRR
ncbi:MAG: hypothetical protein ACYDBJ_19615 [Aggregatilineales bacterium]